ncbi:MAG: MotA/TolQ/ExbB proton channel family protein [Balneolales bacterium]|nr:MotA/TolQ/ExbB proton channel family protein [Balneolales bacterium]
MILLQKGFPFSAISLITDLIKFSPWVTGFVTFIILYFLFFTIWFYLSAKHIRNEFDLIDYSKVEESLSNEKLVLHKKWAEYEKTMSQYGDSLKTTVLANSYFKPSVLLAAKKVNMRLLSTVPGTLVGLGILGTFIGLTFGINNIETSNVELLQNSVSTLLAGMATAFITSIVGMFLSIVYNFTEKITLNNIQSKSDALIAYLDKTYKVSRKDELEYELSRQHDLYSRYFMFKTEYNEELSVGSMLHYIMMESSQQTAALKSFSTDLADVINAGFENILTIQIDEKLMPAINDLKEEIKALSTTLQNPAKEMTEGVIEDLKTAIQNMVADFQKSISETANNEVENMVGMLLDVGDVLKQLPEQMNQVLATVEKTVNSASDQMQSSAESMNNSTVESVSKLEGIFSTASDRFSENFAEIQLTQEILLKQQKDNIDSSDQLLDKFKDTISVAGSMSESVKEVLEEFRGIQLSISGSAEKFREISSTLDKSTDTLSNRVSILERAHTEFDSMVNILGDVGTLLNQLPEKMEHILSSVDLTLDSVSNKMKDSAETMNSNTLKSVEKIESVISSASNQLSNSFTEVQETQKQLLEQQMSNIGASDSLIKRFNETIAAAELAGSSVNATLSEFRLIQESISAISQKFKSISDVIGESSQMLTKRVASLEETSLEMLERNNTIIDNYNQVGIESSERLKEYTDKFAVIEQGLSGVFSELNKGLLGYSSTVEDTTKRFLEQYSSEASKTLDKLSGLLSGIEDLFSELSDEISRIKK